MYNILYITLYCGAFCMRDISHSGQRRPSVLPEIHACINKKRTKIIFLHRALAAVYNMVRKFPSMQL